MGVGMTVTPAGDQASAVRIRIAGGLEPGGDSTLWPGWENEKQTSALHKEV